MKTMKRKYRSPHIQLVKLDSEISLVLNSDPPYGPGEGPLGEAPKYFNNASTPTMDV